MLITLVSKQLKRCIPELSPLIMLLKGGNKITLVSKHLNRCIPEISPLNKLSKGENKITLVSKQLKRCIPELSPLTLYCIQLILVDNCQQYVKTIFFSH
jgi:hypothetical protein